MATSAQFAAIAGAVECEVNSDLVGGKYEGINKFNGVDLNYHQPLNYGPLPDTTDWITTYTRSYRFGEYGHSKPLVSGIQGPHYDPNVELQSQNRPIFKTSAYGEHHSIPYHANVVYPKQSEGYSTYPSLAVASNDDKSLPFRRQNKRDEVAEKTMEAAMEAKLQAAEVARARGDDADYRCSGRVLTASSPLERQAIAYPNKSRPTKVEFGSGLPKTKKGRKVTIR